MSRRVEAWEYEEPLGDPRRSKRSGRSRGWLGWLLFILLLGAAGAFGWYVYLPLRKNALEMNQKGQQTADEARRQVAKLKETEARIADLTTKQEALAGQLVQTVAEKEKLESELKSAQDALSEKLEPEIQAGNVHIVRRGNDLVVDLADQILFDSGKSEVIEKGQEVLGQVAPTLARLSDFSIQVGGHTDGARITSTTTQERFPTNWELSAARATNVVRVLEEQGKVPGSRLVAMGYSMYRPTATNDSAAGRKKNRRIELVLIRNRAPAIAPPPAPTTATTGG
jgi:chemotaxis protein MotB